MTGIVGPSGSGKSSLCMLLPRLYDPDEGCVKIDGTDIRRYTLESLRAQISLVLQDSGIFDMTIAENVAFGLPECSREDIEQACREAELHEQIIKLPNGYDTVVGERGAMLSGGQRQRLALARALVRKPRILILDEPFEGLDAATAEAIRRTILKLAGHCTILIVSHIARHLDGCTRVIEIREGRIAADHPLLAGVEQAMAASERNKSAERLTHDRLPEMFDQSHALWLAGPHLVYGLLTGGGSAAGEWRYWKWNAEKNGGRVTPLWGDKKLFADQSGQPGSGADTIEILAYKPESRLTRRARRDGQMVCVKRYKPDHFPARAAACQLLSAACGQRAPGLAGIDADTREIAWEWIEGRAAGSAVPPEELIALARSLHQFDCEGRVEAGSLRRMGNAEIAAHLRKRLAAASAWIGFFPPSSQRLLQELENKSVGLFQGLASLPPPQTPPSLLHGDFRPRNVLLDAAGVWRLLDADHLALGEREWDYAAWIADAARHDPMAAARQADLIVAADRLDATRLDVYIRAWETLLQLKAIEEKQA